MYNNTKQYELQMHTLHSNNEKAHQNSNTELYNRNNEKAHRNSNTKLYNPQKNSSAVG
jgi:hypothetical protein